jgi:hypothetical protein
MRAKLSRKWQRRKSGCEVSIWQKMPGQPSFDKVDFQGQMQILQFLNEHLKFPEHGCKYKRVFKYSEVWFVYANERLNIWKYGL